VRADPPRAGLLQDVVLVEQGGGATDAAAEADRQPLRVETRIGDNPQGGPFKAEPVPEGFDWDLWLGQTPKVDYIKERGHYNFRWWQAYSGGKLTDWGAHHNDIAQWALGKDGSGPVAVEATGDPEIKEPDRYDHPHNFKVTYRYPEGTELVCTSEGENGVHFEGEDGTLFVSRETIRGDAKKLAKPLESTIKEGDTRLYESNDHMRNFVECVRETDRSTGGPSPGSGVEGCGASIGAPGGSISG